MTLLEAFGDESPENFRALRKAALRPVDELRKFFEKVGVALLPKLDVQIVIDKSLFSSKVHSFLGDALEELVVVDWHDYKVFVLRRVEQGKFVVLLDRQVVWKGFLFLF